MKNLKKSLNLKLKYWNFDLIKKEKLSSIIGVTSTKKPTLSLITSKFSKALKIFFIKSVESVVKYLKG